MIFNMSETNSGGGGENLITVTCSDSNAYWLGNGWEYDEDSQEWYYIGGLEKEFPATIPIGTVLIVNTDMNNPVVINTVSGEEIIVEVVPFSDNQYYFSVPYCNCRIVSGDDL